jgi:hypothetical protein
MTALRTRLGRTKENFWSVAISILAGIVTFVVTYHALIFAFRPADTTWVSPTAALVAPAGRNPCPSNHHHVPPAHDPPGPAAPACAPARR